ncbi:MAG: acyltransferase [bacterium]|nr:acyltransferase [bacterium]
MPSHKIMHNGPTTGRLRQFLGRLSLKLTGWTLETNLPPDSKYVLIGAPHTTNWDFPLMLAATGAWRLKVSWMGKDSLFSSRMGGLLRALGGISIDRSNPNGVVGQISGHFKERDKLVIVMAVSGTRSRTDYWRSGFYWIAKEAQVPIACGFINFKRKVLGVKASFIPSGDIAADMDRIREIYQDVHGKYPENASRIRLKAEDDIN